MLAEYPWNINFSYRYRIIRSDCSKKKAIYIYEKSDPTTFRYRVFNVYQSLLKSASWVVTFFFEDELHLIENSIDQFDIVIFARIRWSFTVDNFLKKVKNRKIPTVFDVDDLVFNLEKIPQIINTICENHNNDSYNFMFSYVSRFWMIGKQCDATIGTNNFMCERLKSSFDKPSFVIQNFLNNEQIEVSQKLYFEKEIKKQQDPFKIGYFSGSPSHKNDFKLIAVELKEILKKYPDTILEIVGCLEIPEILKDDLKRGRIIIRPFVDFRILQEMIASVNVNIVPLIQNEFTNCKSELKFYEAAIVGTITCATPIYSFKNSIQHDQTGFLCEEGDWYSQIEKVYKNEYSPSMAKIAREYCLDRYSPINQISAIETVFDKVKQLL